MSQWKIDFFGILHDLKGPRWAYLFLYLFSLTELLIPSSSTVSYTHFLLFLHSWPHLVDLHLGQGKWHPGQSSMRQSQRSSPFCSNAPLASYRLSFLTFLVLVLPTMPRLDSLYALSLSFCFAFLPLVGSKSAKNRLFSSLLAINCLSALSVVCLGFPFLWLGNPSLERSWSNEPMLGDSGAFSCHQHHTTQLIIF